VSVETVKTALATLQAQITGVTIAYAAAPASLGADLPAFVNFAGAATEDWAALGSESVILERREYRMRLYVAPVQEGIPGEAEARCTPFFRRVFDYFAARPSLGGVVTVQRARIAGDGGVQQLVFNDPFVGIEFRLQVEEYVPVEYADRE